MSGVRKSILQPGVGRRLRREGIESEREMVVKHLTAASANYFAEGLSERGHAAAAMASEIATEAHYDR